MLEYLVRDRSCGLSRAWSMHPDFEKVSLELKCMHQEKEEICH